VSADKRFLLVASTALLLPLVVPLYEALRSNESLKDLLILLPVNYALLVLPQVLVILLAFFKPHYRGKFLNVFLAPTTAALLVFQAWMTFGSDPNAGMMYVFYLAAPLTMLIIAFSVTPGKRRARES
jgi:hypothetical protein